jgi:hypothetical protein
MCPRPVDGFNFHAEGHAFSAVFTRPVPAHIDAKAATSLPTIGGHAHHRLENFEIPRIVRFKAAHTHVSGTFEDEFTATTHSTTTIEGVNVLDVITAERITARLTSHHDLRKHKDKPPKDRPQGAQGEESDNEGHIIALGSTYEGLKIAGYKFEVILRNDLLLECKTHADLNNWYAKNPKHGGIVSKRGGVTLCSLVKEIITDFPGLSPDDKKKHIFHVPHFGTISLAEVLSEEGTKALTMLQFHLGCPDTGSGTMAQARTNGQPAPPAPGGG